MDPFTIVAAVGLAASLVGGLVSMMGSNAQAKEEQRRLRLQAEYADRQAAFVREEGSYVAGRHIASGSEQAGEIRATQAVGGLNPSAGTSALNQAHVQAMARLDAMRVVNNAARQARGYLDQAGEARSSAKKIGEAQQLRNTGSLLGIGGQAAVGLYGLDQEFDIFGGSGLPPTGSFGQTVQDLNAGWSDPRWAKARTAKDALAWLE